MTILTDRELEFLASLNTSWSRLYWNELALLLNVQPGVTVESHSRCMASVDRSTERFRILNGPDAHAQVKAQDRAGIVVD
jgi:predicted Zn-dependent protease